MQRFRTITLPVLLGLACFGCGTAYLPVESIDERSHGTPLSRSEYQRSGDLTWRLGDVERTGDALRIDFSLTNGTSTPVRQGMLRVILYGPDGEQMTGRLPFSGIGVGRSRALSARFAAVPFRVADLGLEIIYVSP
ncbi:MAG: hypothetical protein JRH01_07140 [Deltaproteobacteria bacterium]|nr:hypothetical protein [Deltaproteobacteria bacterium]MBW2394907.1 hypothetical protein [Deltaproteobacteria bacterium]